jgi:hypothetical protein
MIESASTAEEIQASSPYVTDARLFKKCDPEVARLYTDFSALLFITGASSIRILKTLATRGIRIFHVDSLHAKVVMIAGEQFSVGSQNLTVRGRRKNIEASFISGCDTSTSEIRRFFEEIHCKARPISLQEINEMDKLVAPLARKFKEIEKAAKGIDLFLDAKRKLREKIKRRMKAALEKKKREEQEARKRAEEEARKTAEERSKKERSERMRRALADFEKFFRKGDEVKSSRLTARVKVLTNHPRDFMFGRTTSTQSLVPLDRSQNFEQLLKSIGVTPMRYYRYLIVDRTSGKLGFVRFAKGQWTFFASGVRPHQKIMIGGFPWSAEIKFDWRSGGNQSNNGDVHLYVSPLGSDKRIRVASAGFTFSIGGVQLDELVMAPDETLRQFRHLPKVRDFDSVVASRPLQEFLMQHLTKPFKFSSNSIGEQANNFFGGAQGSHYRIQAHRLGNHAIFSAQQQ